MSEDREKNGDTEQNKPVTENPDGSGKDDGYEKVCFMCRRPESKTGKMISLPGGINICTECMQKSFDTMNNSNMNYSDMLNNMPNISMVDLSNLQNQVPKRQRVKKKEEKKETKKEFSVKDIPPPHIIKSRLDEYVIGQEHAKKVMAVAVYNHYKRVFAPSSDDVEIQKSNMLMIGPAGTGKTMVARRMPTIMPAMDLEECIEISKIYSVSRLLSDQEPLILKRPFRNPHHTVSPQALAGGGGRPRPGELTSMI